MNRENRHPYKVLGNEEMETLTESIHAEGILSPLIVCPLEGTEEYEVISGHRRLHAAQRAGLSEVPAFIYEISREEAAIMLVDSNLHREHILPSEKAFAYKLKMDALIHRGTSGQHGQKRSREEISETDSGRQVQRFIRLTELLPEILQMVDDGRISLTPAVEISYLNLREQSNLLYTIRLYLKPRNYTANPKLGFWIWTALFKFFPSENQTNGRISKFPWRRFANSSQRVIPSSRSKTPLCPPFSEKPDARRPERSGKNAAPLYWPGTEADL